MRTLWYEQHRSNQESGAASSSPYDGTVLQATVITGIQGRESYWALAASYWEAESPSTVMAVVITVNYVRCNESQATIGERFLCSQATVSRYVTLLEPVISVLLDDLLARVREAAVKSVVIIDGFIVPTGERSSFEDMYSGKRHCCGANLQAVSGLDGRIIDLSPPLRGSVHDARAFDDSGMAKTYEYHCGTEGPGMLGDKGYIGKVSVTPVRKPEYRELTKEEKAFIDQ